MKKKLNLIGSILSVVALTILSGIEAFASFWLGEHDIKLDCIVTESRIIK